METIEPNPFKGILVAGNKGTGKKASSRLPHLIRDLLYRLLLRIRRKSDFP
ncbi:hypothetical protein [Spirosoma utsteinense]|uniref:Uncharacterized protein n=1 Tax=Spirosoma utsteinense TaxID=2585773 RepID=A0ABR6WEK6_9BACT|nr:hypothetical protein [Spirosoma utsteinense]MBC3794962.1 hypothetical protein [Spirosoma utsteinense]